VNNLGAWWQAARFPSQGLLLVPLLLGHLFGVSQGFHFLSWPVLFSFSGVLCLQLYIVFANDFADLESDRMNPNPSAFAGGSRVLLEGRIRPRTLLTVAIAMASLALLLLFLGGGMVGQPWIVLYGAMGVIFLWAYSFQPLRFSFRGGGEFLQVFGLGIALPLLGFQSMGGAWSWTLFGWLLVLLPSHFACALGTSLPDYQGDCLVGKKTYCTQLGIERTGRVMMLTHLLSALG